MTVSIPLGKMSVEEKIHAMESLWDDLCNRTENVASPSWHRDILAEREAAVERGEENFEDWAVAKRKIKKNIE